MGGDIPPGVVGAGDPKLQSLNSGTWNGAEPSIVILIFGGTQADDTSAIKHKAAMNRRNILMTSLDRARYVGLKDAMKEPCPLYREQS